MATDKKPNPRDTPVTLLDWAQRAGADTAEARGAWEAYEAKRADKDMGGATVSDSEDSRLKLDLQRTQERIRILHGMTQDPEASEEARQMREHRAGLLRQIAAAEQNNATLRERVQAHAAETTRLRNMAKSLTHRAVLEAMERLAERVNDLMRADPLFVRFPSEAPEEVRVLVREAREGQALFGALATRMPSIFDYIDPELEDAVRERAVWHAY